MKKIFVLFCMLLGMRSAWADTDLSTLLNKVTLQLQAQRWVTTKTAMVTVGVNAAVSDAGIERIQNQILGQLNQLSSQGAWHIVSYTRQQDKSGLESIQISAQARLPQIELVNLRSKAKAMSKPGATFTIDDVQFTPSDDEITQANVLLRADIYQQAKAELDALNKMYPDQKYYLHSIEFPIPPVAMPMAAAMYRSNKADESISVSSINVGNKIQLNAVVTAASMPDVLIKKSPLIN